MSQDKGHTIERHEIQLRYFIKSIVNDDDWMKACRMLDDVLAFPTKENVAEIWKFVDAQPKGRSRDEVVKKVFVRKARKPRYLRQPRREPQAKRERVHPCPNCETGTLMLKPNGKSRWPICPTCHKKGSKVSQKAPARLAAPDVEMIMGAPREMFFEILAIADLPEVVLPPVKKKDWRNMRHLNVYKAEEMRRGRRPDRDDRGYRTKRADSLNRR